MRVKSGLVRCLQLADEVARMAQMSEVERYGKRWLLKRSLFRRAVNFCSVEDAMAAYLGERGKLRVCSQPGHQDARRKAQIEVGFLDIGLISGETRLWVVFAFGRLLLGHD